LSYESKKHICYNYYSQQQTKMQHDFLL